MLSSINATPPASNNGAHGARMEAPPAVILTLAGDLDSAVRRLEDRLRDLQPGRVVTLDLRRVTFLGPATTRLLLAANAQAANAGGRLVLWRPTGQPLRALHAARLDRVFDLRSEAWTPPRRHALGPGRAVPAPRPPSPR